VTFERTERRCFESPAHDGKTDAESEHPVPRSSSGDWQKWAPAPQPDLLAGGLFGAPDRLTTTGARTARAPADPRDGKRRTHANCVRPQKKERKRGNENDAAGHDDRPRPDIYVKQKTKRSVACPVERHERRVWLAAAAVVVSTPTAVRPGPSSGLGQCLFAYATRAFCKIFQISRHIESLNACMKY